MPKTTRKAAAPRKSRARVGDYKPTKRHAARKRAEAATPEAKATAQVYLRISLPRENAAQTAQRIAALLRLQVMLHDGTEKTAFDPPERKSAELAVGKASAVILDLARRPDGTTSKELFAATGWKFASWSHQLKRLSTTQGLPYRTEKVGGELHYYLGAE